MKIPPNFEKAKIHGEATRIKDFSKPLNPENLEGTQCSCCNGSTFKVYPKFTYFNGLKMGEKLNDYKGIFKLGHELKGLGSGFPLFYNLKSFAIVAFFIMGVIYGLPALLINLLAGNAK